MRQPSAEVGQKWLGAYLMDDKGHPFEGFCEDWEVQAPHLFENMIVIIWRLRKHFLQPIYNIIFGLDLQRLCETLLVTLKAEDLQGNADQLNIKH